MALFCFMLLTALIFFPGGVEMFERGQQELDEGTFIEQRKEPHVRDCHAEDSK